MKKEKREKINNEIMSDYRDILLKALKEGKTMDSCGLDEQYYDFGLYTDLCGMSVEDAIKSVTQCCCGGGGSDTGNTKTNNPIIISAEQNTEGKYAVKVKAAYPTTAPVVVTFTIDGQNATATIPAGSSEAFVEGIVLDSQYATIEGINIATSDEVYKYTATSQIADGLFVLTYKIDGKTVHELRIKVGSKIEKFVPEEKTGYLFKGWVPAEPETMPDKDITIVAKYSINVHKITYFVDNEKVHEQNYNYHAAIDEYTYTKEGYTISAWVGLPEDMLMPDEDLEIHATSTVIEYNVTFNVDGVEYETKKVAYGAVIALPTTDPIKTGYTFKQWVGVPETMPANDVIIEAEFAINSYELKFMNGDVAITAFTVEYNAVLADYAAQAIGMVESKEGYTFTWDSAVPTTMPAENVVIVGSYKEQKELLYHGMIKEQDFGTLTEGMVSAYASSNPSENIVFTILPNEEYQKQLAISEAAETDEEAAEAEAWMREFEKNNTYSFVIAIPSKYTKVKFLYVEMDEAEVSDFQKEANTMNLNGEEYALWVAHHEMLEKNNAYAPRAKEYKETYKLVLN